MIKVLLVLFGMFPSWQEEPQVEELSDVIQNELINDPDHILENLEARGILPEGINRIADLLSHRESMVRVNACSILGQLGEKAAKYKHRLMNVATSDVEVWVRSAAFFAVAEVDPRIDVERISKALLTSENPYERTSVVESLGYYHNCPAVQGLLLAALQDKDLVVVANAVRASRKILPDDVAVPVLLSLLQDREKSSYSEWLSGCVCHCGDLRSDIFSELEHRQGNEKLIAARLKPLLPELKKGKLTYPYFQCLKLLMLKDPTNSSWFEEMCEHALNPDKDIRESVAYDVVSMCAKQNALIPYALRLLNDEETDVCQMAVIALAEHREEFQNNDEIPELSRYLLDPDLEIRETALDGLKAAETVAEDERRLDAVLEHDSFRHKGNPHSLIKFAAQTRGVNWLIDLVEKRYRNKQLDLELTIKILKALPPKHAIEIMGKLMSRPVEQEHSVLFARQIQDIKNRLGN